MASSMVTSLRPWYHWWHARSLHVQCNDYTAAAAGVLPYHFLEAMTGMDLAVLDCLFYRLKAGNIVLGVQ